MWHVWSFIEGLEKVAWKISQHWASGIDIILWTKISWYTIHDIRYKPLFLRRTIFLPEEQAWVFTSTSQSADTFCDILPNHVFLGCVSDLPADCSDLFDRGERNSGVYAIRPNQSEPFNVYCEMSSGRHKDTSNPSSEQSFDSSKTHCCHSTKTIQSQLWYTIPPY